MHTAVLYLFGNDKERKKQEKELDELHGCELRVVSCRQGSESRNCGINQRNCGMLVLGNDLYGFGEFDRTVFINRDFYVRQLASHEKQPRVPRGAATSDSLRS